MYGLVENYQYDKDRASAANDEAHLKAEISQVDARNEALANMTARLRSELKSNKAEIARLKQGVRKGTISHDEAEAKLASMKKENEKYKKTLAEAKKQQKIFKNDSASAREHGYYTQSDELDAKLALYERNVSELEGLVMTMGDEREALQL